MVIGIVSFLLIPINAYAEPSFEVGTPSKESGRWVIPLIGTGYIPDTKISANLGHHSKFPETLQGTFAGGETRTDTDGNFSLELKPRYSLLETDEYNLTLYSTSREDFVVTLEFEHFREDILTAVITPNKITKDVPTLIDISGNLDELSSERDVLLFFVKPSGQQQFSFGEPLSEQNTFHLARELTFDEEGQWILVFYLDGLLRTTVFDVIESVSSLESVSTPELEISAESKLPEWVRNIFIWYAEGIIEEDDLINALQFLIKEGIIKI